MKILAFAASNSRQSINKKLVTHAIDLLHQLDSQLDIELLELNDFEMPLFSVDREQEHGIPEHAHKFYSKIGEADALLVSFAEHNAAYTVAYKNLYDWTSRIDMKVYQGKPSVLLAASPGPGGAANVLKIAKTSAPYFGMELKAGMSIARFFDQFDMETGTLSNQELSAQLHDCLTALINS